MLKLLDLIWTNLSEMVKMNVDDTAVNDVKLRYTDVVVLRNEYLTLLQKEVVTREIQKKEKFTIDYHCYPLPWQCVSSLIPH